MTREEFIEILNNEDSKWEDDNAFKGCVICSKYTKYIIQGADHDIIYGPDIDDLIKGGITEEDVRELALLNWGFDDYYLVCYV